MIRKQGAAEPALYDANFALAFACQTLFVIANAGQAHYARWITFLGGDERDVGWIMAGGSIVSLALRPWLGQWIDRIGDRRAMVAGAIIYALCLAANPLLTGIGPAIYLLRAAVLASAAVFFASSLTYITRTAPPERRTEAIGSLGAGGFMGILIGPVMGDAILGEPDPARANFLLLFLTMTVGVALGIVLMTWLRPTRRSADAPYRSPSFIPLVRRHWPGRILLVDAAFGVCMVGIFVFVAKFVDAVGLVDLGPFFVVYAGWGLSLRLGLARIGERWGERTVVVIGLVAFAIGMASFNLVVADKPWRLMIPALLCGTGHALVFHHMVALTIRPFPESSQGVGSVLALMLLDAGQVAGAPVLGGIAYYLGFGWVYHVVSVVCLAAAGVMLLPQKPSGQGFGPT